MPPEDVLVQWQVAEDEGMGKVVRPAARPRRRRTGGIRCMWRCRGWRRTGCTGISSRAGGEVSAVGRTRTTPAGQRDAGPASQFAFASCQHYEHGYYQRPSDTWRQEDLHAVVHLGDYIYEYGPSSKYVRKHNSPEDRIAGGLSQPLRPLQARCSICRRPTHAFPVDRDLGRP